MNTPKLFKMVVILSFMLIIAACGSSEVQDSITHTINSQDNQIEETNDEIVNEEVVEEDLGSAESENEAAEQISAYPFLVWANGGTFKIITEETLPDKLIGKKLGEVSSTLTDDEVGNLEQGQTYEKLDRIDGESNYLKKGSAIYQLKKADANEVVLVEHNGSLYKAVRIDN